VIRRNQRQQRMKNSLWAACGPRRRSARRSFRCSTTRRPTLAELRGVLLQEHVWRVREGLL
jgi:hypothetical protein